MADTQVMPESGVNGFIFSGSYNFHEGRLFIPIATTLADMPVGSIYYVPASGVLAIASGTGGQYSTFTLTGL